MQPTFPGPSATIVQDAITPVAAPPAPVEPPRPQPAYAQVAPPGSPRRFRTRRKDVHFFVDEDRFDCVPLIPAETMLDFSELGVELQAAPNKRKLELVLEIFESIMLDESYARFKARMSDKDNPIDFETLMDVVRWLFGEAYSVRPTRPPSPSQPGSSASDSGPSSTGGAPAAGSTSDGSTGVASSTSPTTS